MNRSRIVASFVSVAVVSSVIVAPAQALESTVEKNTCTITLSLSEQEDWDAATAKKNDINEASIMPLSVQVKDATSTKSKFEEKLTGVDGGLEYMLEDYETQLSVGVEDDDQRELLEGNLAVIKQIQKNAKAYKNALDSCANRESYDSDKDDSIETKPDTGDSKDAGNTSSQMSDEVLYTLLGLMSTAVLTGIAYVVSHGGINLGNVKLPF